MVETKTMPSQMVIIEYIRAQDGASSKEVAQAFDIPAGKMAPKLIGYRERGLLKGSSKKFTITSAGIAAIDGDDGGGGSKEDEDRETLPTEATAFKDMGRIWIKDEGMLDLITNLIWRSDPYDPQWVWKILSESGLSMDKVRPWASSWFTRTNTTVPPELEDILKSPPPKRSAADERTKETDEAGGKGGKGERRYLVTGDQILADPEGEWTFAQALAIRGQNMGFPAGKGVGSDSAEKPSDLVNAIVGAVGGAGKLSDTEQMLLTDLIERAQGSPNEVSPEMDRRLRDIESKVAPPSAGGGTDTLSSFQGLMGIFANILGYDSVSALGHALHGGNTKEGIRNVGALTDKEGNPISIDEWLKVEEAKHKWKREDEDADQRRDQTKNLRQMVSGLGPAIQSAAQSIRGIREEAQKGTAPSWGPCDGCGAKVDIPPGATEVTCPNCSTVNKVD